MPLQETLDTYSYFITEADKLNLAYFTLVRYHPSQDGEYDGTYSRRKHPPDSIINQNYYQVLNVRHRTTFSRLTVHISRTPN